MAEKLGGLCVVKDDPVIPADHDGGERDF